MYEEFDRYFDTLRILLALKERYKADDVWECHATKTIILPTRIEAPSKTIWGKAWQRIRKAAGLVYIHEGGEISLRVGSEKTRQRFLTRSVSLPHTIQSR